MSSEELNAEITSTEPIQEPLAQAEPEPSEPVSSQPTIDHEALAARAAELLRGEITQQIADGIYRVKESQRDAIKSRFLEFEKKYLERASELDELKKAGLLDAQAVVERKQVLRDEVDRQRLEATEQPAPEQVPQKQATHEAEWRAEVLEAFRDNDLREGDPELQDFLKHKWVAMGDGSGPIKEMWRVARALGRKKNARLADEVLQTRKSEKEQQRMSEEKKKAAQAKAVNVDTGASTGTAPRTRATVEAELEQYQKMPPGMGREEREARRKKAFELAEELDRLPAG